MKLARRTLGLSTLAIILIILLILALGGGGFAGGGYYYGPGEGLTGRVARERRLLSAFVRQSCASRRCARAG